MFKFLKLCVLAVLVSACSPKDENLSKMVVKTQNGDVVYMVESATTKEQMSKGLMDRKELREDSGMIFDVQGTEEIAMWMKDTYIPLDVLFVNSKGKIIWIEENAEPLSTTLIRPKVKEPMAVVIEINAGDVKKHAIKLGDIVTHELIK